MSKQNLAIAASSSIDESSTSISIKAAQVELVEDLTHDEARDRSELELRVEQAFYQAGKALAQLRQRRLYRSTHRTFEAYCQDRFGFTRRYSDYLIRGAVVVENLQQTRTIHSQNQLNEQKETNENLRTMPAAILPTKLEQIKPLANLKPQEQQQVWNKAVAIANGKVPSGRIVRGIVEQLNQKSSVSTNSVFQAGDVFILVRLAGKERKYNGCWAIAVEQSEYAVIVDVHDTTLTVKPKNLNKIDLFKAQQQLPQILQRIRRLHAVGILDRGSDNVLEDLAKQTDLTPVEEGLLSWLEKYYKVDAQASEL